MTVSLYSSGGSDPVTKNMKNQDGDPGAKTILIRIRNISFFVCGECMYNVNSYIYGKEGNFNLKIRVGVIVEDKILSKKSWIFDRF